MSTFSLNSGTYNGNIPEVGQVFRGKGDEQNLWMRTSNGFVQLDFNNAGDWIGGASNIINNNPAAGGADTFKDTGGVSSVGSKIERAKQWLSNQGVNYNSIPEFNKGDILSTFGSNAFDNAKSAGTDFTSFKQAIANPPSGTNEKIVGPATPGFNGVPASNANPAASNPLPKAPTGTDLTAPFQNGAKAPTTNLQPGMTGDSVKQLQDYLVSKGFMTQAQVNTGYGTYGSQTTAAVKALQQSMGVDNSTGPGFFGPRTIAALQASPGGTPALPGTPGTTPGGTPGGNQGGGLTYQPTGDPALDKVLEGISQIGSNLISSGYTIPAGLQITPDLVQKFLDYAHQNVDPYYKQLLDSKITDVNANLKNLGAQFELSKGQTLQDFGTNLATEQETSGGAGTAFSGLRNLTESNLAKSTNRSLASLTGNAEYNMGSALRGGAADVGATNAGSIASPSLYTGDVSLTGGSRGSFNPTRSLDFSYNPSIYGVGNIPSAQGQAARQLQQTYLGQYGTLAGSQSGTGRSVSDLTSIMGLT